MTASRRASSRRVRAGRRRARARRPAAGAGRRARSATSSVSRSTSSIGAHRRLATQPAARGVSDAVGRRVPARSRARRSRTSAACSSTLLQVQHAHRPTRFARASSSKATSACARRSRAGKGAIIFSGHFGYWELQGLAQPLVLPPMSVLARPLDNPYLHALLEDMRRRDRQSRDLPPGRAAASAARAQRERVRRDADRPAHSRAPTPSRVDFFNRPAATTSALATLALRTGAPLDSGLRAAARRRPLPARSTSIRSSCRRRDAADPVAS